MSGSDQEWGGAGGKRKCSKAEASRDAELQTTKGVPASASARTEGQDTVGSDSV
jgi:hypothetical protein